eukprot:TRINITY_DN242_c7_g1_i1.p1 TRINITY_DN242_c7_g1~~TRINITY_DN242_c7_g1_i1.p1  ORF type:complete len:386 (+),score=36.21 TRINITY_DN242_c7_g1_i1:80-1159(+)
MPPSSIPPPCAPADKMNIKRERQRNREMIDRGDGKQGVATPWQPGGAEGNAFALGNEVKALAELMKLTPREEKARQHIDTVLSAAAAGSNYNAELIDDYFQSRLLPQPSGSILVHSYVLYGFTEMGGLAFTRHLNKHGVECSRDSTGVYMQLSYDGYSTMVCIQPSKCVTGMNIKSLLRKYPVAEVVFTTVWLVLHQSRCNLVETGGLSADAVMMLVLFCCTKTANPDDAGQVLVDFFAGFGSSLEGCVMVPGSVYPDVKTSPGAPCFITHPFTGENLTPCLTRHKQITAVFRHCGETIAKWSGSFYTGYRGRTPLSSILAYDHLWERVDIVAQDTEGERPLHGFSPSWDPVTTAAGEP